MPGSQVPSLRAQHDLPIPGTRATEQGHSCWATGQRLAPQGWQRRRGAGVAAGKAPGGPFAVSSRGWHLAQPGGQPRPLPGVPPPKCSSRCRPGACSVLVPACVPGPPCSPTPIGETEAQGESPGHWLPLDRELLDLGAHCPFWSSSICGSHPAHAEAWQPGPQDTGVQTWRLPVPRPGTPAPQCPCGTWHGHLAHCEHCWCSRSSEQQAESLSLRGGGLGPRHTD